MKFKRFTKPSFLKEIGRELLGQFLGRFRDGLTERKIELPAPALPGLLTKHNPLCQGQFRRVIDRDGLPAHVVLPGIAAALASAAGFLLAPEGAADLRAARAEVDVGQAAIAAAAGKKLFSLA